MGFFHFLGGPDINREVETCRETPGGLLVDVRTPEEYRQGHIPGSVNLPLGEIGQVDRIGAQADTPLFLYCRSGARSGQASAFLRRMGYRSVHNIGGIAAYRGKVER